MCALDQKIQRQNLQSPETHHNSRFYDTKSHAISLPTPSLIIGSSETRARPKVTAVFQS